MFQLIDSFKIKVNIFFHICKHAWVVGKKSHIYLFYFISISTQLQAASLGHSFPQEDCCLCETSIGEREDEILYTSCRQKNFHVLDSEHHTGRYLLLGHNWQCLESFLAAVTKVKGVLLDSI